jgi:hypothetical protein
MRQTMPDEHYGYGKSGVAAGFAPGLLPVRLLKQTLMMQLLL